ncbi:MAG: 50S ribosomal protein L9 [Lentisphaerae bacterium GWF2_44_16]|nr:MAG: 50S ribosomal protein L9 [Lentisphaerae bacterium GWF2_44_16]
MASVKLILLEDVENLGLAGEEISVSPGYARNYLVPRKLAATASQGALRQLAARKEKIEEHRKEELEGAKSLASKIAENEVTIQMEASDDNRLFGSVTNRVIAEKLAEKGIQIEHHRIRLDGHIRELGTFNIDIKLHSEITATLKLSIVRV